MDSNANLNNCTNIDVNSCTDSGCPVLKANPRGETMSRRRRQSKQKTSYNKSLEQSMAEGLDRYGGTVNTGASSSKSDCKKIGS